MSKVSFTILGAGSWGTAIAIHLAACGHTVFLWGRDTGHMEEMAHDRANARYLPNAAFPPTLKLISSLKEAVDTADFVIIAVPSHAFATLLYQIPQPRKGLAWLTKGLDPVHHELLSAVVANRFGSSYPVAMITGPSFAAEVAAFLPTALTLASNNIAFQKELQQYLHCRHLRVYLSNDLIGVQICATVKNVLAIACGISDGLGYGANAKAAIMTRGLAEMRRLGLALGAKEESFIGLAGVGDLILTCTDNQSRNRRFGLYLGQGLSIEEAEKQISQVVEGKHNAKQICELASAHHIELPICTQVYQLLKGSTTPKEAVAALMNRVIGSEHKTD